MCVPGKMTRIEEPIEIEIETAQGWYGGLYFLDKQQADCNQDTRLYALFTSFSLEFIHRIE